MRAAWRAQAAALLRTARAVAALDVLAALAEVAHERGYVRPVVDDGAALDDRRRPPSGAGGAAGTPFTPNDVALDADGSQIVILTGPNMAGKCVFMRQTALLVILAQMGSFVPARAARIGAGRPHLHAGGRAGQPRARPESTFLVEMVETASILHNVTARSLVLLDEVGRGTSTFDGLAIAWAVVEELHERARGREGALRHPLPRAHRSWRSGCRGVRNFHVAVREWNDEIVFLHKVRPGGTDRCYGIQVARLAGLPAAVIARAKAHPRPLEARSTRARPGDARSSARRRPVRGRRARARAARRSFRTRRRSHPRGIAALDIGTLTPLAALSRLAAWRARSGSAAREPDQAACPITWSTRSRRARWSSGPPRW